MAKSVKALITPEVLRWAREEHIRLDLPQASNLIKVPVETLEKWEIGDEQPSIRQLKEIAKKYNIHITIFYLPEPPDGFPMLVDHRVLGGSIAVDDQQSYRLKVNVIEAYQRREIIKYLYELLDMSPPEVTLKIDRKDQANKTAEKIRQFLEFADEALPRTKDHNKAYKFWKKIVESKGILVCQTISHLPMDLETVRGFCIAERPFPVIVINSKDSPNGKIFSIIHELVHIGLGQSTIQNTDLEEIEASKLNEIEVYCNAVAGAFLVPKDELLNLVELKSLEEDLPKISMHFQVSDEVILRRLLSLNKISKRKYQELRARLRNGSNQRQGGYPVPPHTRLLNISGEFFARTAFSAYYEEQITISELTSYFSNCDTRHLNKIESTIFA